MVRKAYQYVLKEKDTVHIVKNAAGVVVCYYLLSQTQTVFKKISASLVAKYEAACTGFIPAGTGCKWEKILPICASMYKVEVVASDGRQVLECELNPYNLACQLCKGFAHDGICKHVLAVTHLIMRSRPALEQKSANKLRYMCLTVGKKRTQARVAKTPALQPSRHLDSSDEEEEELRRIEDGEAF